MKMEPVISSNIRAIGYADGEMHIEFTSGRTYAYTGPKVQEHYYAMKAAKSIGSYVYKHVRSCPHTKSREL